MSSKGSALVAGKGRLLVVSNRLPIIIEDHGDGAPRVRAASGGLVTALSPVLEANRGLWLGWPGIPGELTLEHELREFARNLPYELRAIPLREEQVQRFYRGFANETLWPLFHDLLGYCYFEEANWLSYRETNRRFARATKQAARPADLIWIHDYHLAMTGQYLRELGMRSKLCYFLHIPFPSRDLFRRLPWRQELVRALLAYDLLGFQTRVDRRNFVECVRDLFPGVEVEIRDRLTRIRHGRHVTCVGAFPISIDFAAFDRDSGAEEVQEQAREFYRRLNARTIIMGLDRLDYTKGIPERLQAFERALERYPQLIEKVSLYQVIIPSRTKVPDYIDLKGLIDGHIGRINGRFSRHGWVPIHYVYGHLDRVQLLAAYRVCDVALVTPLRDGMNLVAKEYCASRPDRGGVLILSEFAGAADQLQKGALIVNPYDTERTAEAIYLACTMEAQERRERMASLRAVVRRNDVFQWVGSFLAARTAVARPGGRRAPRR